MLIELTATTVEPITANEVLYLKICQSTFARAATAVALAQWLIPMVPDTVTALDSGRLIQNAVAPAGEKVILKVPAPAVVLVVAREMDEPEAVAPRVPMVKSCGEPETPVKVRGMLVKK